MLLRAVVLWSCVAGCSKKSTEPQPAPEAVNSYPPNANARIVSQTILGDANQQTFLGYLERADDASFVFHGVDNSTRGLGTLNATGSVRWFLARPAGPVSIGRGRRRGLRRGLRRALLQLR